MEELIQALRVLLSDTVALKFKAHGYHWNVEGDDFPQYHDFFQDIYQDYDGAVDTFAEWIRKLGEYAPYKLSRFQAFSDVPETDVTSDPVAMSADLLMANDMVTVKLLDTFDLATALRQQALANFLAERQDMHQRWHWMLSAVIKPTAE
jgi:starvation-inducible DNA-binding protein